jgi:hypothetical protein
MARQISYGYIVFKHETDFGYDEYIINTSAVDGHVYEIGEDNTLEGPLELYSNGYHFYENPLDVDLRRNPGEYDGLEYGLVEISGDIAHDNSEYISCTNRIKLIRKLTRRELLDCITVKVMNQQFQEVVGQNNGFLMESLIEKVVNLR